MNGSERRPEHATADAGSALDVAGIDEVLEAALKLHLAEALGWDWDEDAPSHVPSVAEVIAGVLADLVPAITPAVAAHVVTLMEADRAAVEVLRELVRLKDGPRDAAYEQLKPMTWAAAREAIARSES